MACVYTQMPFYTLSEVPRLGLHSRAHRHNHLDSSGSGDRGLHVLVVTAVLAGTGGQQRMQPSHVPATGTVTVAICRLALAQTARPPVRQTDGVTGGYRLCA